MSAKAEFLPPVALVRPELLALEVAAAAIGLGERAGEPLDEALQLGSRFEATELEPLVEQTACWSELSSRPR